MTSFTHASPPVALSELAPWLLDQLDEAIAFFSADLRLVCFNQSLVKRWELDSEWLQTQPTWSDFLQTVSQQQQWLPEQRETMEQLLELAWRSPHQPLTPNADINLNASRYSKSPPLRLKLTGYPDRSFLLTLLPTPPANSPEQQLQEERLRLLESVVVHANDSILITEAEPLESPGPRILYVNPAFTRITGYLPEEVLGKTPRLLQGPNTDPATVARLRTSLHNWEATVVELLNYRKDRSEFWVELSVVPVMNQEGRYTHWIAVQRDINQRKRVETELQNTLQQQIEVSQMRSRFVSMTSHEFRTPLTSILSASELLEHYGHAWTEEERLEQLHLIQSTVQHMTQLLDDILLIGRSEGGRLEVYPVWFDVVTFCHTLTSSIQNSVGREHLITFDSQITRPYAFLDQKLLQRILSNLLSNAAKYSPQGTLIRFDLEQDVDNLTFIIQDEGIGIPIEDQAHLFDFFYRGNNVGTTPGTGLGLAIVKNCVDLCKGQIRVESTPNVGTLFRVTLPASTEATRPE
ncbi:MULTISPECIES: PAS domain-containing sensor histidine kinase [unclassified Leptolyngbya]|uniref:PAS domain-containing sensor histidine kinase n=1 Tax=unclassified Leptolyngbya TaxID=2650499 RepID=UPI001681F4D5|nr:MULTISPECIES: PAS domain-containing sensor histidine kinase [unclassified Leptolyngbya]MBD1911740.1 PAS domain-containing sensor histidine kinase [Leptolyngbya sp. FACHB-8]MBD2157339.1 PAS domain-containing sensor histidine kinase [Leptolyngbya sp. FACHB-16]